MGPHRLRRWQRITLGTLLVGYAGYYLCRSDLSVAVPLMLKDLAGQQIDKENLGAVASVGIFFYAIGKVSNSILADFLGGRRLFVAGMVASVVCTLLFGLGQGLAVFMAVWAVNRYVQSAGWGALVKIAARWFPQRWHGTAMGALSMSYLVGDALARLYLGLFIQHGVGWRGVFFISGATLGAIAVVSWLLLKESPRAVGGEEPAVNPHNLFGTEGDAPRPPGLLALLRPLLGSFSLWMVCLVSCGLTIIRETFNFWSPTYLSEVAGLDFGAAAMGSLFFPLVGAAVALLAGLLTDRLRGIHGRVMVPSLILLIASLGLMAMLDARGKPVLALVLLSLVSCFLMAPYTFCAGVIALDLGGKRGSATAAGLIDSAGYLGATVISGYGVGRIAETRGWPTAFRVLALVAGLTLVAAALYWLRQEISLGRRRAIPPEEKS
jgi:OPA family glycerol-3-phosphate transporter-like MFS transporter